MRSQIAAFATFTVFIFLIGQVRSDAPGYGPGNNIGESIFQERPIETSNLLPKDKKSTSTVDSLFTWKEYLADKVKDFVKGVKHDIYCLRNKKDPECQFNRLRQRIHRLKNALKSMSILNFLDVGILPPNGPEMKKLMPYIQTIPVFKESDRMDWYRFLGSRDFHKKKKVSVYIHDPECFTKHIMVFFPGNGMDLRISQDWSKEIDATLSKANYCMIIMESPGFGMSRFRNGWSSKTEINLLMASRSLISWLVTEKKIEFQRLSILSYSMGSGPAINVARGLSFYAREHNMNNLEALIAVAPYLSGRAVIRDCFGDAAARFVLLDRFKSYKMVEEVTCPTLYIHGIYDGVIPEYHSRTLFNSQKNVELNLKERYLMSNDHFFRSHHLAEIAQAIRLFLYRTSIARHSAIGAKDIFT